MNIEKNNCEDSLEYLNNNAIDYAVLKPTKTALDKSIIDAIYSLRKYLDKKNYHDYSMQKQGDKYKVVKKTSILLENNIIETQTSFYRPLTKKGDPRIWIYDVKKIASPNDNLLLIVDNSELFVINISKYSLKKIVNEANNNNEIYNFLKNINQISEIAKELKNKLKSISSMGFIEGKKGDKEVGVLLEKILGLNPNSSKSPDFKGIELKAKHNNNTRANLFAQVPNYKHPLSKIKKITDIADHFGYLQGGQKILKHTISAKKINSLGLFFRVDFNQEILIETSDRKNEFQDFAIWEFSKLENRLLEKHKETFWIDAQKKIENDKQYFKYISYTHTANPRINIFMDLIASGIVTMDHLISVRNNSRIEKGPLFKIKPIDINKLLPTVQKVDLSSL